MSSYSEGQSHQLMDSVEAAGWSSAHVTKAGQSRPLLVGFRGVLDGTHEIRPIEHIIDLGGAARLPFDSAVLESHRGSGIVRVELREDGVYLGGRRLGGLFRAKAQKKSTILGHDLRKECDKRSDMLPAVVLDFMVEHPELYPDEWKADAEGNTIYVFFMDDIFRYPADDSLCVRCGYWGGGRVRTRCLWLGRKFYRHYPVASFAS